MSSKDLRQLKPFFSIIIITVTLFLIVFLQMEERRMGYSILKLTREFKKVTEEKRVQEIALAKYTRPQLLDSVAQQKFTLKKVEANQIIHLSGSSSSAQAKKLPKTIEKKDL